MNTGKPAKPGGMKAAYETAYQRACGEIRGRDLEELCVRSGAALNGRRIRLSFFGAAVQIDIPENGELEFQPPELPLVSP